MTNHQEDWHGTAEGLDFLGGRRGEARRAVQHSEKRCVLLRKAEACGIMGNGLEEHLLSGKEFKLCDKLCLKPKAKRKRS